MSFDFGGSGAVQAAAGGVAALGAAALNNAGTRHANRQNRKLVREQMSFQKEANQLQMDFQERMSNTAYQRSMEDMRKAGLNPILAYNQGGASSPSGSTSAGASATMQNEFGGAVSSALDVLRTKAELKNMKQQNVNLMMDTGKKQSEILLNDRQADLAWENIRAVQANTAKSNMETKVMQSEAIRKWVDTLNPFKFLKR